MERAVPYDREVLLTGRLVARRTFAGPPGSSSNPRGDRAKSFLVLELDHEVYVSHPHFPHEDPQTVRRVPLWIHRDDAKEGASLEKLVASAVGRRVMIKVILFVGKTHHHSNITGNLRHLKLKGSRDFPALERSSPDVLAAAEAEVLAPSSSS
jgi:hypothetical protein